MQSLYDIKSPNSLTPKQKKSCKKNGSKMQIQRQIRLYATEILYPRQYQVNNSTPTSIIVSYSAFFDALVLSFINANTKAYPLMAKMTLIPASLQPW